VRWPCPARTAPLQLGRTSDLLPAEPELRVVRQLLGERRTVLDLGCGTGRIADPLAAEGCHVVAVDESAALLERVLAEPGLCVASTNGPWVVATPGRSTAPQGDPLPEYGVRDR